MRPESRLQSAVVKFARHCNEGPHLVLAHDRSAPTDSMDHFWQSTRGVLAGTPDTQLLVPGFSVWCELKWARGKPSERQYDIGRQIIAAGHKWFWTNSVEGYRAGLEAAGVALTPNARVVAMNYDAALVEAAGGVVRKATRQPRAEKPTRRALNAVARARGKGVFS